MRYIRAHGYRARYGGHDYVYPELGEHKYWTMGAAVTETTIINRAQVRRDATRAQPAPEVDQRA